MNQSDLTIIPAYKEKRHWNVRNIINDNHRLGYGYSCSVRTGMQTDDQSSQEQYAFYYDTCKVVLLGQPVVFPDAAGDDFVREPCLARFSAREGSFSFVPVTIHTSPDEPDRFTIRGPDYIWIIPDSAKTNLATGSDLGSYPGVGRVQD
ncbi:MAG: hypothetical protein V1733_03990 [bacterium]